MAGVAYYNTGTATVAVNSKIVTGTGTNWLSVVGGLTAIKAGDKFGIHVGRPIIIASVDSNTQLTLEDNWPGPAQTNAAYRIELTNPAVIAVEALRRVLGSLSGGILYGVSQLTAAPNKALTIDENGAAALADLTTFGKSLIAALNSSTAYNALGTIPNAQLPTRLQGSPTFVTAANALDVINETGWVGVANSNVAIVNGPPGAGAGNCFTSVHNGAAMFQWYFSVGALNTVFFRRKLNADISAWVKIATEDFAKNASNLLTGEISDSVLPPGLKAAGMLSAEVLFSGFSRLNTLPSTGYSKSQNGENLVLTSTATDPQLYFTLGAPGSRARYIAFRMKRTAGSSENIVLYSTSGHSYSGSYIKTWSRENSGDWTTVVLDMWSLTAGGSDWKDSNIINVRIDFTNSAGGVIELAWIGAFRDSPVTYPQDSVTDTRPGAPMIVGAFGLGSTGILLTAADDLNNLPIATCSYRWGSTAVPQNAPSGGSFVMEQTSFGSGGCVQTAYNLSGTNIILHRKQAGGVWTSWKRIDGSSDAVGDVTGPNGGVVANDLAVFADATAKVLKKAPNSIVTNALLSNVATATIKGRTAAGTGDVQDLTPAQARTVMDVAPTVARQVRLGAVAEFGTTAFVWNEAAAGGFVTGMFLDGAWGVRNIRHRTVQQTDVSGNWVTVAQV